MESSAPFPIEPGERVLAAIVFTDVVNFSARVQAEEISTLSLLEQDFAVMTKYCERYSGSVLKSTGDGLLLYFGSAVHAVTCAMQIQQFFGKRAKTHPATQTLVHRVGVHLGDVFVKDQDVMGDGVNIASRLQTVADPGGICISQTVYDVVKNKLALTVERLAPRDLKNITDIGAMYRVLLEPRKAAPAPAAFEAPRPQQRPTFSGTEKLIGVLLLLAALAVVARLMIKAHSSQQKALAESEETQAAVEAILRDKKSPRLDGAGTIAAGAATESKPARDNFAELLANRKTETPQTEAEKILVQQRAADATVALVAWVKTAMRRYTKEAPLLMPRLNAAMPTTLTAYADSEDHYVFITGGAARARAWDELKLADQEALIVGTLRESPSAPPPEVMTGADAFAYLHDLPEMITALHPRKE